LGLGRKFRDSVGEQRLLVVACMFAEGDGGLSLRQTQTDRFRADGVLSLPGHYRFSLLI